MLTQDLQHQPSSFVTIGIMKVGLDISQIAHKGGVGVYTKNLAEQLVEILGIEIVFFYSSLRKPYWGDLPHVRSFRLPPIIFEVLFNRVRVIPIDQFIGNTDVFHSSDWTQPPTKAKKVTTYHDVIPLKYPEWSHPKIVEVHKKRLSLVEKEIDMVVAVSEATKKDLLEVSKIPEDKVVVIYEGVDERFKRRDEKEVEEFRKRYQLPDKFILVIGGIGKRRNLPRVKEATSGYNLVVAGETIPWVGETEMPLLYNAATLLAYPSLYEGFGLPVLEAMASGTPVVTSNTSSLPEVGDKAAIFVNPYDVNEMKVKIRQVMEDKELRKEAVKKGLEWVKNFSWKKCAEETVEVYRKVMGK